nr:hypothetical protein BaRGS_007990 [Batillaria attramentaria]
MAYVEFNGRGSNYMNWFSRDRIISSSWTDLRTQPQNYFSIEGTIYGRFSSARHSTETVLLRVFDDLLTAGDSDQISILTLLDLSAAFDTIDHDVLLGRLERVFGIRGIALCLFESYIRGREQ